MVKNVKWEALEVFMMLYTMFNGTRLEASIANFTGGYMEICQWLIGNGNNWLIYIGVNSVNIVCAPCFQNLSDVFFTGYPCVPHALSGHRSYQYRWCFKTPKGIQRGPLPQPHLWWIYMKTSDMNNYQRGAVSAVAVEWSCRRQNSSWTSTGWWSRQDLCPLKISRALFFTAEEDICVQMSISLLKDQREPSRQCLCGGSPRLVTG